MKKYNFDEIINRHGTNCLKQDALKDFFGREDLIPLWVADMDFKTPDFIMEAIRKRCEHEVLAYTFSGDKYHNAIINWLKHKHNWTVEKSMLGFIPGVVPGLAMCINCFTNMNDTVIVQPPVYPPFLHVPEKCGRKVVLNPLLLGNGQFNMDFNQLESICDNRCKMLILCNPHNPGGRMWSKKELIMLADICYEKNIFVVSDEIHADLALAGRMHIPFASVSEKANSNSITLMAPSKTFNIAGLGSSFYVATNSDVKKKFSDYLANNALDHGHIFAFTATQAAYENGEDWLNQLTDYVQKNVRFVDNFLKSNIPQIKAIIPEASFLIWLDCRELKMTQPELVSFFINEARLALNDGITFGIGGEDFMRLNIGCPQSVLEKAMLQLKEAYYKVKGKR